MTEIEPKLEPGVAGIFNGKHEIQDAKDWKDILSAECSSRKNSVMQSMHRVLAKPGMLSLGPGAPSNQYFPFYNIDFEVPWAGTFAKAGIPESRNKLHAGKYDSRNELSLYDLAIALQYGQATGSAQFLKFISDHIKIFHNPPYKNWKCIQTAGNTSSTDVALRMFGKPGDYILVENYTYPTLVETGVPLGYKFASVKMDKYGILAEDLDDVLVNWDEEARKAKKPHLLYMVPTGQNPSGTTQPIERRQEVYKVAQKHNLYILEDDPYYYIQMPAYDPEYQHIDTPSPVVTSVEEFAKSLVPSYLSIDIDGRVFRMDSVSKVIVPGARLGWVTASEQVIERMTRVHEVSTQNPSGFSQIALYKLLHDSWGHEGFASWLKNLQGEYTQRRNTLVHCCEQYLPQDLVTWEPPTAGFFLWVSVDWIKHPDAISKTAREFETEIYEEAIKCGTLVVPGSWFIPDGDETRAEVFFRMTFAASSPEDMAEAIKRLGIAIRRVFLIKE